MKNDMKPSLRPFFFVNASCDFARNACTALMSHSLKVVRMAAVCCAMTSCGRDLAPQWRHFSAGETIRLVRLSVEASLRRQRSLARGRRCLAILRGRERVSFC